MIPHKVASSNRVVNILTTLRTGQSKSPCSIPSREKRRLPFPKRPDFIWTHPTSLLKSRAVTG